MLYTVGLFSKGKGGRCAWFMDECLGGYVFKKLLLVCVGNICRSPTAEILMRHALRDRVGVEVSSAGLQALVGKPIDPMAAEILREHGLDPDGHRARQATPEVLSAADLILVMEQAHVSRILRDAPQVSGKTFLLGRWDSLEVPDPYRQQRIAFEHVYALIDKSVDRWSKYVK
ncbi:low molecular weight protein-tyrosine-phosphatase [Stenotrophomonas bentonitica]|uniref:protein-tyrosine-phosphatase n=1 Tax=Stenotrophomonas bentonitica TaxID=1450134 RepID=A0ABU9JKD9_9GAMM